MTSLVIILPTPRRRSRLRDLAAAMLASWERARRRREARRYLLEMDERMLSDIGISRTQALFEMDRRR